MVWQYQRSAIPEYNFCIYVNDSGNRLAATENVSRQYKKKKNALMRDENFIND